MRLTDHGAVTPPKGAVLAEEGIESQQAPAQGAKVVRSITSQPTPALPAGQLGERLQGSHGDAD
jgi:hypothetical protein